MMQHEAAETACCLRSPQQHSTPLLVEEVVIVKLVYPIRLTFTMHGKCPMAAMGLVRQGPKIYHS